MTDATEPFAISISQLRKCFDHVAALEGLDLQVAHGCIFGLLGPNGAGKSTAIKMLTTLLDPTSGSATVAGFDIARQPVEVRRHIGYVPQMLSADGALTAIENLNLSARLHGLHGAQRRARVKDAIAFAGLEASASKLVRTYSGGMIRRLEIAQATLHNPQVLFLDEPTIGLDPIARRTVWERLEQLRDKGTTILITTHDMEEADTLCDELAILHQGRLAVVGKPDALKAQVGEQASLDDVFVHFSGVGLEQDGNYRGTRDSRDAIQRLG
ncbi:ABC transporter ATP-binding protein [Pseudomonas extremaustralis]|jgi:ABC-2 type transport system ATP-binding protein|uniref:ABC-2 type transport system ATP-binding protein n=1 Tax=Pseudomonas extremaustralis TaxID=359110 RepID=A0A5C5QQB8_9PSED|nr:ATP-binding cassette domain-containing protein [Pseudomonas extremaustralis]EZI30097.1 multidrug ABC transporter ATP-binding protein [Pseudomonas extremaustralis 14-3 substr. 14-3b]MDB1111044.1 ATP-binding cassette domain-containing protein [Pseudomonas extremaustralis]MDF3133240.1 ATP-binding cassette domain-containing protein [Pseudomonas extremaustralis]TWS07387.1 ATP-binding cassette domain-containing protein [Pseudomonas extremaustralis]SDE97043.1 ABC-2 type transport system ATP-bindin